MIYLVPFVFGFESKDVWLKRKTNQMSLGIWNSIPKTMFTWAKWCAMAYVRHICWYALWSLIRFELMERCLCPPSPVFFWDFGISHLIGYDLWASQTHIAHNTHENIIPLVRQDIIAAAVYYLSNGCINHFKHVSSM